MAGQSSDFSRQLDEVNPDVNIVLTCSLTKFASLGLNKANLGLLYGQAIDIPSIFKHIYSFQSTEGYPSLHTIAAMPMVTDELLSERKKRFGNNAQFLAQELDQRYSGEVEVIYPGLPSHQDYQSVLNDTDNYAGPFFFIKFKDLEQAKLFLIEIESFYDKFIEIGTSYGLNKTRMELTRDEFGLEVGRVRISPGTENIIKLMIVLQAIEAGIEVALS